MSAVAAARSVARALYSSPLTAPWDAQGAGHLLVAVAHVGGSDDDLALQGRQGRDLGEGLANDQAAVDVGLAHAHPVGGVGEPVAILGSVAQRVDGAVMHDPVQPRLDVAHLGCAPQRDPGLQQGLLKDVLGAGLRERQPPAVAQQRPAVAVHERLEGTLMTLTDERYEPPVRLGCQQAGWDSWTP